MFTFQGQIDSKGRITVPSKVRNKLNLDTADTVTLLLRKVRKETFSAENTEEAVKILADLENVESFQFNETKLEVFFSE